MYAKLFIRDKFLGEICTMEGYNKEESPLNEQTFSLLPRVTSDPIKGGGVLSNNSILLSKKSLVCYF